MVRCFLGVALTLASAASAQVPELIGTFGAPSTFATHAQLAGFGFSYGPSDGTFGAVPLGGGNYIFYGDAGGANASACAGSPTLAGAYSFTGTLDHVTGSNGCKRVFGPGDAPSGWTFDKDYAGGGQVVRFSSGGRSGWMMVFHGELHWQNLANPPSFLCGDATGAVPCFYSGLGLAISTDGGRTFDVVGQIMQPSQPLSVFQGAAKNMAVGYGSLIVADANGKHLDNPPPNPSAAYFYLFYTDSLPGAPGVCGTTPCLGVARAVYADVVTAAFSGDPHQVARVFHKYDGTWTQPATSDTPDVSGTAGKFAPLWSDERGNQAQVLYDSAFDCYLAIYQSATGVKVRASNDLFHWSEPIGPEYQEAGRTLYYPTLMGETGDPTIAGSAPRVYFSSFPTGQFPNYGLSVFETTTLTLSWEKHRAVRH